MDDVQKSIEIDADIERVWRALTDSAEFGTWFGVALDGPFAVGRQTSGQLTTPGYEKLRLELTVVVLERPTRFAFRWHPHAVDPDFDYAAEPSTHVEFTLVDDNGRTRLTVRESGFDRLPATRARTSREANDGGWAIQIQRVKVHAER